MNSPVSRLYVLVILVFLLFVGLDRAQYTCTDAVSGRRVMVVFFKAPANCR